MSAKELIQENSLEGKKFRTGAGGLIKRDRELTVLVWFSASLTLFRVSCSSYF